MGDCRLGLRGVEDLLLVRLEQVVAVWQLILRGGRAVDMVLRAEILMGQQRGRMLRLITTTQPSTAKEFTLNRNRSTQIEMMVVKSNPVRKAKIVARVEQSNQQKQQFQEKKAPNHLLL